MGIEPTRSLFPDPSPVLKTGPGTSRGRAPDIADKRRNMTVHAGTPYFQGAGIRRLLNNHSGYHVRNRRIATRNVTCALAVCFNRQFAPGSSSQEGGGIAESVFDHQ
jgi:hypothetical protein